MLLVSISMHGWVTRLLHSLHSSICSVMHDRNTGVQQCGAALQYFQLWHQQIIPEYLDLLHTIGPDDPTLLCSGMNCTCQGHVTPYTQKCCEIFCHAVGVVQWPVSEMIATQLFWLGSTHRCYHVHAFMLSYNRMAILLTLPAAIRALHPALMSGGACKKIPAQPHNTHHQRQPSATARSVQLSCSHTRA